MTARTRVLLVVGVSAVAAAATAVGVAVVQRGETSEAVRRPAGSPPLVLELGLRSDPEARALRRAFALYHAGRRDAAARIFARSSSLDARVGEALARWPHGTVPALERLAREQPGRALVRLNLGFALLWSGQRDGALAAFRAARRIEPDSPSAVEADNVLHPRFKSGLPVFTPNFAPPRALATLPPARQFEVLRREAATGGVRTNLLYGIALQRLERPISARRAYDAAVPLAPDDPEPLVAAAVARFDKARPTATFARLGPLTRRFPRSATVRFNLGVCLLWLGDVDDGVRQLRLAKRYGGMTPLGREARRFLRRLADTDVNRNRD